MPSFQTIIAFLIVAGAAFFLVRRIYKSLKKSASASCGCGCSGCNAAADRQDSQTGDGGCC
jgi:hypothetical protein